MEPRCRPSLSIGKHAAGALANAGKADPTCAELGFASGGNARNLPPSRCIPKAAMTHELKIALAQLNPTVGDVTGNLALLRKARATAASKGADLVLYGELVLSGYPPEDLVLKPAFQQACRSALEQLARDTADGGPAMLVGSPWREGDALHN